MIEFVVVQVGVDVRGDGDRGVAHGLLQEPQIGACSPISVWASEHDLQRFIGLPYHADIMQRYGTRGTVRSTKWHADQFEPNLLVERARIWISGRPT